ncbi:MAG TPA: glycosyltransferase [Solirubrobacteraceae bacterium]|nr:glycosyltransferase [Solirubrobacteraceae bacterium]
MTLSPEVSVCIPTRNQGAFLAAAVSSALAQDVDNLEVLVHDDASEDDTAAVVAGFADPRVGYLRHPRQIGVAANRDSCLEAARGRYVAWLDSDDERLPGSLSVQLAVLDAHPEVALVHGGCVVVDAGGRRLPDWPAPFAQDSIEPSPVAFSHLVAANELTTSTVVVRHGAHSDAGPFAGDIGPSSTDWEMWLRIALSGDVAYTSAPVARYRQHGDSISHTTAAGGERLRCNVRVLERVLREQRDRIADPERVATVAYAALAAHAVLHAGDAYTRGARAEALDAVALARRLQPSAHGRLAELRQATLDGDDGACMRLTRALLGELADKLGGTRLAHRLRATADGDEAWEAQLRRAGAAVARITPADAVIAAIAKWDPTVVAASGRAGCNYPDRSLHPDGYPRDGASAVAHLEALRAQRHVTHVVVPGFSAWWLDHYPELARWLGAPLWQDRDCTIFEVGRA